MQTQVNIPRGVFAVRAEGADTKAVLSELQGAWTEFKQKHDHEVAQLRGEIDTLNANRVAAMLGAGSQHTDRAVGEVNAGLAGFVRTGSMERIHAAMNTGSDSDGGYLVAPVLSDQINQKIWDVSPIGRLARRQSIDSGDAFEEPFDNGDVGADWVGESDARPSNSNATISYLRVPVDEVYCHQVVTQRLLDDSRFNLGAWLTNKIADKFSRVEGSAFVSGDGIQKPKGILAYTTSASDDATRTWGEIQYVPTGSDTGFAATDPADALIDLVYSLRAPYRAGAVWLMNRTTAGIVRKFKDADGRYLWSEGLAGQPPSLLGFPVELDEDMPDIAAGSLPVAFGNIEQAYIVVDKPGVKFLRDPFTNKPNVIFYAYRRVGGRVQNYEALKLLKVAAA